MYFNYNNDGVNVDSTAEIPCDYTVMSGVSVIAKKTIRDAGCTIHYVAEAIPQEASEAALMKGLRIQGGFLFSAASSKYRSWYAL